MKPGTLKKREIIMFGLFRNQRFLFAFGPLFNPLHDLIGADETLQVLPLNVVCAETRAPLLNDNELEGGFFYISVAEPDEDALAEELLWSATQVRPFGYMRALPYRWYHREIFSFQ